jgi:hypothetical protein
MKILTIASFAALLLIGSCSTGKDNECSGVYGTLKFINQSGYKYDIYINDVKKATLAVGASSSWPLTMDYYAVKAIQADGINGTPLEHTWNSAVKACSTTEVTIP